MANVARLGGYGDTSGSGLMFRNKLINGGFDIWQRATSQTSSGYGSDDRWKNDHIVSSKTASRQTFAVGQTDVPGNPTYFSRTVATSVAGSTAYVLKNQRIESVSTFAGQTCTLSFWAKADSTKNMAVEFLQFFGTGGSPSADITAIGVTTINLTSTWKYFTVTANIPSISGKTLGTNGDDFLALYFWFDAGSTYNSRTNSLGQQSGTFDIANVQLEAGPQPTPFEKRPLGVEIFLCQRYYQQVAGSSNGLLTSSYQVAGSVETNEIRLSAPTRDINTAAVSSPLSGSFSLQNSFGAAVGSLTGVTQLSSGKTQNSIRLVFPGSNLAAGDAKFVYLSTNTIWLSNEL